VASISPAIANEFIRMAAAEGRQLTQMQLQKLAYLAHGWNLAVNGVPLVSDEMQAWDYGPVFPMLYEHAKYFGSSPIPRPLTDKDDNRIEFFFADEAGAGPGKPYVASLSDAERAVIDHVWRRYGTYSAFKLSDLTHKPGSPWFETYFGHGKSAPIENDLVRKHYLELAERAAA
jgi:uncharacterized phage-associated protein